MRVALLLLTLAGAARAQEPPTTPPPPPEATTPPTTPTTTPPTEATPPPTEATPTPPPVETPPEPTPEPTPEPEPEPTPVAPLPDVSTSNFEGSLFGYIDTFFEQDAPTPVGVDKNGDTTYQNNPYEWDIFDLHVMAQGTVFQRFRYFLNLAATSSGSVVDDSTLDVRNAWVEAPLFGDYLNVRAGKTYRRFGLYNEILDAAPTFIGIEPPELFDKDHLMLTRTTNLMLHGRVAAGDHFLSYAFMTGNDEREGFQVPIGADVFYDFASTLRLGTSFYWTGGKALPSRDEGSPAGGVINWMAEDNYYVVGGYGQLTVADLILQAEGWVAPHSGLRDPAKVLALTGAAFNPAQLERFGLDGYDPDEGDVVEAVDYNVITAYLRAGYTFFIDIEGLPYPMEIVPYAQFDYYSNPETIAEKDFGGDNEAGISDDGVFYKATLGVVYRPAPPVALKVDASTHTQLFNGVYETYPELRVSFSYFWELGALR
jgi:hypothetical protein